MTAELVKVSVNQNMLKTWSVMKHGFVVFVNDEVRLAINLQNKWDMEESDVWMNPEDLAEHVKLTDDYSTNCCGPDGMEGPNRRCKCGELIGSEESECFQLGIFRPDEAKTYWKSL